MEKKKFTLHCHIFFIIMFIALIITIPLHAMRLFKKDKQPPDLQELLIILQKKTNLESSELFSAYKQTIIKQQKEPNNKEYEEIFDKLLTIKKLVLTNTRKNGFEKNYFTLASKEEIAHFIWCCIRLEKKNNFFIDNVPAIIKDYALKYKVLMNFKSNAPKTQEELTEEFQLIDLLRADAQLPKSLSLIDACKTKDKKEIILSLFTDWRKDHSTLLERLNDVESLFQALKIAQQNGLLKWITKIKPISRYTEFYNLTESTKCERPLRLLTKDLNDNKKNAQEVTQLWLESAPKLHNKIIKYLKHWDEKTIRELGPFYSYPFIWLAHKNFAGLLQNNLQLSRNYVANALMQAAPEHIISKLKQRKEEIITIFCEKRKPNCIILAQLLVMIYGKEIFSNSDLLPENLKKTVQLYPKIKINLHQEQAKIISIEQQKKIMQNLYAYLIQHIMVDIEFKIDA